MGVSRRIEPLYRVAVQLKTLIAEGMATTKLSKEKVMLAKGDWMVVNMWCPHTRKLMTAMAMLENATNLYPNIGLREKQVMISLTTAMPGRIMMYTAGCE